MTSGSRSVESVRASQGACGLALAAAVAIAACGLAGCEFPAEPPPRPEDTPSAIAPQLQARNAEAAKLYRAVETYFNAYLALHPVQATALGDHRFDDRFGDYASASWMADSLGIEQESLERLAAVDPKQLQGDDLVSYQAFRLQRETSIYGYRYPSELLAIDPFANRALEFARLASGQGVHPFRTTADYDHFLARMDGFVAWTEQVINNLRSGVSKGVVLPKVVVERTLPQLAQFAQIEDPRQSVFWQPLLAFPAGPSVADRKRLLAAWDEKLRTRVIPAYRRLHDYLATEYLPQARETVAWADLPSGDLWYAWLVRKHTDTELKPADVHALGLREMTRLRANLANLQPSLGVGGDVRALLDAMRADSGSSVPDPAALVGRYDALRARVEAGLPALFARVPKAKLAIRSVEPWRASTEPAASYQVPSVDGARPGVLYVNARDVASRPAYLATPTFLQQALPGRHYQAAIAQQTVSLPSFRRFGSETPYVAGWAAYAATLTAPLGLEEDAQAQFGALAVDLARTAALVIDTGVHSQGWARSRAVEYLRANTALSEVDIQTEVDRVIAHPGEALAYKVGELKILDLRRRAEQKLGARFDVRQFHEQVVAGGVLPLPVLEGKIDRWIAGQR